MDLSDPEKIAVAWGAGSTGTRMLWSLIGPTTKAAGKGIASYAKQAFKNVGLVHSDAKRKLKIRNKKGGSVPARVGKAALEQATVCENSVIASYLGGVMASANTKTAKEDMAVSYLATIQSLSSYQLKAHAILYASMLEIPMPVYARLRTEYFREWCTVLFEEKDFLNAMGLSRSDKSAIISRHCFTGLSSKRLIEGGVKLIFPSDKRGTRLTSPLLYRTLKASEVVSTPFRFFNPTFDGMELFVWALGYGDKGLNAYRPDFLKRVTMPVKAIPLQITVGKSTFG
jgi:hypothetical protein